MSITKLLLKFAPAAAGSLDDGLEGTVQAGRLRARGSRSQPDPPQGAAEVGPAQMARRAFQPDAPRHGLLHLATSDGRDDDFIPFYESSSKPDPAGKIPDQQGQADPTGPELNPVKKRRLELERWREERNRRREIEKKNAKPVFKVGVVHHKVYSPPTSTLPKTPPPQKLCKMKGTQPEPSTKWISRATEKRLAIKAVQNQQKRENIRKNQKKLESHPKDGLAQAPLAPDDHQFKAPSGIATIPMFGRQALEATKENMSPSSTTN